jgi:cytochrome c2
MLFALSTGHQIGLAAMGAAFVVFSLASSFVFPRFNPDFPTKKGLRWYLPLSGAFFIAMMAAILILAKEKKTAEASSGSTTEATTTAAGTTTTETGGGMLTSGPYANGDAAAGKTVFLVNGACGSCHTLKAAGSTGTIGPPLDALAEDAAKAGQALGGYTVSAILHPPPAYVPPGYPTNVMPTTFGTSLTKKQIADLVAFLDESVGP